jgi:hypothetical protein
MRKKTHLNNLIIPLNPNFFCWVVEKIKNVFSPKLSEKRKNIFSVSQHSLYKKTLQCYAIDIGILKIGVEK